MFTIKNLKENTNIIMKETAGPFTVCEHIQDRSLDPVNAAAEYYSSKMNIRQRQLLCQVTVQEGIVLQAGAMQWMAGDVAATSGIKGVGDFFGKMIGGSVSGEAGIKPEYAGNGVIMSEPTYKHLLTIDVSKWGSGIVVEDGMFLACTARLKRSIVSRKSLSSAVAGNEGLFNLCLSGTGYAVLESVCPAEELIEIELDRDVLKIDGSLAVAWSADLEFTVEKAGRSLIGSAASGEGLVNVYKGTGKVLLAPVA
ncbi:AIM24 family protein [uncultured Dubosiella sp.]|mgnify:CR=1 FL=1|uniref:AIM24 family protein n=1 Tax=uncultured Dubosiella sp. TaxID=1937011 RepID=UPI0020804E86|nr:AIM24 family protein [uncultured Dubosiella sp.]GJM58051.1 transcriptional regulator [Erysipelotrichaceae bacterium OPF54]